MSALLEKKKVKDTTLSPDSGDGDHDKFAHFFKKEDVDNAIFTGKPAKALCGKMDIPMSSVTERAVCPTCKETYEKLRG